MKLEKPINPNEIKPYCVNYLLSVWHPNVTYKDVEQFQKDLDVSMPYLKKVLRELKLTYITERDMVRYGKEKYLREVWCKQPRESRLTVEELSKKLECDSASLSRMIKRLGLEEYMLTGSERSHRQNQERRTKKLESNIEVLNSLYCNYKETGRQYLLEEIYIKMKSMPFNVLKRELKRLKYQDMVKPYAEKCSKSQRFSYYNMNKSLIRKNPNYALLAIKFGISAYQVKEELKELDIVRPSSRSDYFMDDRDINEATFDSNSYMSFDDLNKILGLPKDTYNSSDI